MAAWTASVALRYLVLYGHGRHIAEVVVVPGVVDDHVTGRRHLPRDPRERGRALPDHRERRGDPVPAQDPEDLRRVHRARAVVDGQRDDLRPVLQGVHGLAIGQSGLLVTWRARHVPGQPRVPGRGEVGGLASPGWGRGAGPCAGRGAGPRAGPASRGVRRGTELRPRAARPRVVLRIHRCRRARQQRGTAGGKQYPPRHRETSRTPPIAVAPHMHIPVPSPTSANSV